MNIQSALNSVLGDIGNVAFRSGIIKHMQKTEDWFGEPPSKDSRLTKEEKKQNKIQDELLQSGDAGPQAEQDYVSSLEQSLEKERGEKKALLNIIEKTETKNNQKESFAERKDTLKKGRILNRHGVLYQEVIKDGK